MTPSQSQVLVVGAEPTIGAFLRRTLAANGLQVMLTADTRALPARCELDQPALLLLDMHQVGPDGLELCRQIQQRVALPILVLGGAVDRDLLLAALDAGADDCLIA